MDLGNAVLNPGAEKRPYRVGVVIAYTSGAATMTVNIDGSAVTLPCLTGPAYAVNDTVLVARDGNRGGYVLGRFGAAPTPPPTPGPSTPTQRTAMLLPVQRGTWYPSASAWNSDSRVSENDGTGETGTWFYGVQFPALHADTSQPYSATLTLLLLSYSGSAVPDLRLGTENVKPLLGPTLNETLTGPSLPLGQAVDVALPSAWVLALLNGTRGSVAVHKDLTTFSKLLNFGLPGEYAAQAAIKITYWA